MYDIILIYKNYIQQSQIILDIHKEKKMLDFLFKKETSNAELLNDFYSKLREMYSFESISDERKEYLKCQSTVIFHILTLKR